MIFDDVLMCGRTENHLLAYLRTVLDVLKQHHTTIKLKKCKYFQNRCKFVGMDLADSGTQTAQSKNEAFSKLEWKNTRGYLHMLIGIFGFYIQYLPLYDLDIRRWRYILSKQPQLGKLYQT